MSCWMAGGWWSFPHAVHMLNRKKMEERKNIEANLNGQQEVWGLRRTFVKSWRPVSASETLRSQSKVGLPDRCHCCPCCQCCQCWALTQMEWAALERAWSVEDIRIGASRASKRQVWNRKGRFFSFKRLKRTISCISWVTKSKGCWSCWETLLHHDDTFLSCTQDSSGMVSSVRRIHDYRIQLYLQFMPNHFTVSQQREQLTFASRMIKHHMLFDESMVHIGTQLARKLWHGPSGERHVLQRCKISSGQVASLSEHG